MVLGIRLTSADGPEALSRVVDPLIPGQNKKTSAVRFPVCRVYLGVEDASRTLRGEKGTIVEDQPSTAIIDAPTDMTDWQCVRDFQTRCDTSAPRSRLVLDLRSVRWADSKLIACIVLATRRARDRAVRVEIKPSRCVNRWAALCRVDAMLRRATGS